MPESKDSLIEKKTLLHIPCKSSYIEQESENYTYKLKIDGNIYYDQEKECIYGANVKNVRDNEYNKLILINDEKEKNYDNPIILEFYADIDKNENSYNDFIKIYFNNGKTLNINLVNININTNTGKKEILDKFEYSSGYYFIQIDPNNGRFELYIDEKKIITIYINDLKDIIIDKIELYLGLIMLKKIQKRVNMYSGDYQNNPSLLYNYYTEPFIQHNIYYKNIQIITGQYDEYDIKNRLAYSNSQKFKHIVAYNTNRIFLSVNNKYIDELVNINIKNLEITDIGLLDHIFNYTYTNIDCVSNIFNNTGKRDTIYLKTENSSITTIVKNKKEINNFTIELDLSVYNKYVNHNTSIFSIYDDNGLILQMLCYYYKDYCEFGFKSIKLDIEEYYKTNYNFINKIVIVKSNSGIIFFINNKMIYFKSIDFKFNYNKIIIGKSDYKSFIGYISKFIFIDKERYTNTCKQIKENLNKNYKEISNSFSVNIEFDLCRQKTVLNQILETPVPDKNYLIYVDFINNEIKNRGKTNDIFFKCESTPVFKSNEFPGDSYSSALIASSKNQLTIEYPSKLNLADLSKFSIEIDFKILVESKYCDSIKLFTNDTLGTYMTFENGYLVFYIGNKYGQQIKLKYYYQFDKNSIVHVTLQKNNNMFYLIIDDVLVFTNSITNLSQFFIEKIYENLSSIDMMIINRFSISDIERYDLKSLKDYSIDSNSLLYLPFDSMTNFKNNKFIMSEDNNFDISMSYPTLINSEFQQGYGALSFGSTLNLISSKKSKENISLYFWNKLISNNVVIPNLDCTILKIQGPELENKDVNILEIVIVNSYSIAIKTSIIDNNGNLKDGNKTQSIIFPKNDVTKNMYNIWNNFAFTYDKKEYIFTLFLNGKSIYSGKLLYFDVDDIKSISLFTNYKYGNTHNNGNMYIASIRLSKGLYYNQNFVSNISGLLYKSFITNISNSKTNEIEHVIYAKYPENDVAKASLIFDNHKIPIQIELENYFTFESWFYTTENRDSADPLSISFKKDNNVLYTLYLTKLSSEKFMIRNSDNIDNDKNNDKTFPENHWTHIAIVYIKETDKLKVWANGHLILSGKYNGKISLIEINTIELNPGSGNSYFNDLNIFSSVKYMDDIFIPPNTLLAKEELIENSQNIPQLIYSRHDNNDVSNTIDISNGFSSKLYNALDIGHTIEFWLYTTENNENTAIPLTIDIMEENNISIHKIILTKYFADNSDDVHWDQNITYYQNSGFILIPNIWTHFALVYNRSKNTIKLYCNGKEILNSTFRLSISLTKFKQIVITPSSGKTYIDMFMQVPQSLYNEDFIPNNGILSGLNLPMSKLEESDIQEDIISNTIIGDRIGSLDDNYITYLDFEENLKDKSKSQTEWKPYGMIQYVKNIFPYEPMGKAVLLNGNNGIYTNDTSLNFNNFKDFTIEFEIKNYTNFLYQKTILFVNFISWLNIVLNNDTIEVKYNCKDNQIFSLYSKIDLNEMIYIAIQKQNNVLSIYINGSLMDKIDIPKGTKLENYLKMYKNNIDHVIDIGMMSFGKNNYTNNSFNGYINKIAISDIARFDDNVEKMIIEKSRNESIVFHQPIKGPDYDAIYRTTPRNEPWNWKYKTKNCKVYNDKILNYNTKWKNYSSFGPSKEDKTGFIEYSNTDVYHKSFTFEFWSYKDPDFSSTIESDMLFISNSFIISLDPNNKIILYKYAINNKTKLLELTTDNNFSTKWNHFALTYNYFTKILHLFINGKLLFVTLEFSKFLPSLIKLYTNTILEDPIYFTSIRYSKGIIYKDNFNISIVNKPYTDYEENDKIDFNLLPEYSKKQSNINDDGLVFYLQFKNGNSSNTGSQFSFTSSNSSLYKE